MSNRISHPFRLAIVGGALAMALTNGALGQRSSAGNALDRSPVDQGFADVSPLGTSLISSPYDLRAVRQFDQVYRVPGRSDLLMRQSGALSAVFTRSDYVQTENGVVPTIPAGTIYYIGPVPAYHWPTLTPPSGRPVTPTLAQVATQPVTQPVTSELPTLPQAAPLAAPASARDQLRNRVSTSASRRLITISDEFYRRKRLRTIAAQLSRDG